MVDCVIADIFMNKKQNNQDDQNMGSSPSKPNEEKRRKTKQVDMLMLGISGSGKSTVLKQMKIIHLGGFSEEERTSYSQSIIFSIFTSTMKILEDVGKSYLKDQNVSSLVSEIKLIQGQFTSSDKADKKRSVLSYIKTFFSSKKGQELLKTGSSKGSQQQDACLLNYFLDRIDEIVKENYIPSTDDLLHMRTSTTGAVDLHFRYRELRFRITDVGGQRSERRKWLHLFQGIDAVIYVVDISAYDVIDEESKTNSLIESLSVFKYISGNDWLKGSDIILFFNKIDLFKAKLSRVPLSVCFPHYQEEGDVDDAVRFIKEEFIKTGNEIIKRDFYSFITCATDTGSLDLTFRAASNILIRKSLQGAGML